MLLIATLTLALRLPSFRLGQQPQQLEQALLAQAATDDARATLRAFEELERAAPARADLLDNADAGPIAPAAGVGRGVAAGAPRLHPGVVRGARAAVCERRAAGWRVAESGMTPSSLSIDPIYGRLSQILTYTDPIQPSTSAPSQIPAAHTQPSAHCPVSRPPSSQAHPTPSPISHFSLVVLAERGEAGEGVSRAAVGASFT
jgi:hypothetical protein